MTARKNESCTSLVSSKIITDEDICKTFVQIGTDVILISVKPIQLVLLICSSHIYNKLLKQPASVKDSGGFMLTNMQMKLVESTLIKFEDVMPMTMILQGEIFVPTLFTLRK